MLNICYRSHSVCLRVCVCVCVFMHMSVRVWRGAFFISHVYVCVCGLIYRSMCMFACVCVCVRVCKQTFVYLDHIRQLVSTLL